jgi:hypothetical protein
MPFFLAKEQHDKCADPLLHDFPYRELDKKAFPKFHRKVRSYVHLHIS